MSGFPNRTSRKAFGPQLVNPKPITNPSTQADAGAFNLAFWQMAGAGLMVSRAWALVDGTSASAVLSANGESWNSDKSIASPIPAYTSTGIYTLTYLPTYPDEKGNAVLFVPLFVVAIAVNSLSRRIATATFSGTVITINLRTSPADALVDGAVALLVY